MARLATIEPKLNDSPRNDGGAPGSQVQLGAPVLLKLLQLCSSTLPTGGFAYSHGLETMVEARRIVDENTAIAYLTTLLVESIGCLDLPRLLRMHSALSSGDELEAERQSAWLFAARESREFQAQERQMASALGKALAQWRLLAVSTFDSTPRTYAEMFARAAVAIDVDSPVCCIGYAYVWVDSHVSALSRLVPFGPMSSQRVLCAVLDWVPRAVSTAFDLDEDEIGASTPGLALASARHEIQHYRLFRS